MGMQSEARGRAMAGINVTPMADIMIVLLIIFMVMTPLIDQGHVRHLPPAAHSREQKEAADRLVVSVAADGRTFLGQRQVPADALLPELQAGLAGSREAVVYIKADEELSYSSVERVVDACRAAGAEEVAFISRRRIGG